MKYLEQLNYFDHWTEGHYLPGKAQLMWFKLMQFNNRLHWQKEFQLDNRRLMIMTDINNERDLISTRKRLIDAGMIRFTRGHKGHPSRYEILPFWVSQDGIIHTGAEERSEIQEESETVKDIDFQYVSKNESKSVSKNDSKCDSKSVSESVSQSEVETDSKDKKKTIPKEHRPKANAYKAVSDFEEKTAYGEFKNVWLKDGEIETLRTKYPDLLDLIIDKLANYKSAHNRGYASDYSAINNWVAKEVLNDLHKQQMNSEKMSGDEMLELIIAGGGENEQTGDWTTNQTNASELSEFSC